MRLRATLPTFALVTLAGAAAGQTVDLHILGGLTGLNHPAALPAGEFLQTVETIGRGRSLLTTSANRTFIADGALTQVCIAGTQIPGQAPGVVWGSAMPHSQAFPLRDRPPIFTLSASGGGMPNNAERTFLGDPASAAPFWMSPAIGTITRCTPNALTFDLLADGELRVGPVDGPRTTLIPTGYTPPGFNAPIRSWDQVSADLNSGGTFLGVCTLSDQRTWILAAVDSAGFRPILARGQTVHTDRGDLLGPTVVSPGRQVLADGSALASVLATFEGSVRTSFIRISPEGSATMIAATGDPAPGCPAGYTLALSRILAATPNGKVLWAADLRNNGTPAGQAFFLWSGGRSRLILRSGTPVAGAPAGATARSMSLDTLFTAQVNDDGAVALLASTPPQAAYLYTPQAGTVEALRPDGQRTLNFDGFSLAVNGVSIGYGVYAGGSPMFRSGGDDTAADVLAGDGTLTLAATAATGGSFACTARISSPGCRPDYNADGFLDFFDYDAFLECFEGGGCANGKDADFNNDDFADFFDFIDFVDAFEHGC